MRDVVTDYMDAGIRGNRGRVRQESEVHGFLEGLRMLEPGLVEASTWRPDSDLAPRQATQKRIEFGGAGRKE